MICEVLGWPAVIVTFHFSFNKSPSSITVSSVDVFQVEVLKEKIEEDRGRDAFPAAGQKLIYAGEPEANFGRVGENPPHWNILFSHTQGPRICLVCLFASEMIWWTTQLTKSLINCLLAFLNDCLWYIFSYCMEKKCSRTLIANFFLINSLITNISSSSWW